MSIPAIGLLRCSSDNREFGISIDLVNYTLQVAIMRFMSALELEVSITKRREIPKR